MIISGGVNIYPQEVEDLFSLHPAVADIAVIGVPDDRVGEEVCAVVVAAAPIDGDELLAWSREHLGRHKYPRRVEFFEALPLGPSGKILKREIVKDL